jgi:serine/threonine protein kinase
MFNNIMNTRIDTAPLQRANISDECIDLLCKMLQTDPASRPTDVQCLNHPWLRDGATILQDPFLDSIVEEEEEDEFAEQELSQLSINEEIGESDEVDGVLQDEEFGRLLDHRAPKRIRTDPLFPRNQLRDEDEVSSADVSFQGGPAFSSADVAEESFQVFKTPDRPRLFGEIRQSALDSSGILNALADEALSQNGPSSEVLPDSALPQNVTPEAQRANGINGTPKAAARPMQFHGSFSSPSLLGAESLVRELNMESPQSPGSGAHSPNEPATPKTPEMHQHSSLRNPSQLSQFSDATPKAKPPTLNRQISLPKTASFYYDPYDPSTHNLEYASKVSGYDFVSAAERAKTSGPKLPDTVRISAESETDANSETSKSQTSEGSIANRAVPSLSMELGIKPPPRRLGKLTTTPESFLSNFTLNIDRARTSWGRHPEATVVYPNSHDTRVPKMAFVVVFYRKNADNPTVQELSQRGEDWTTAEDLQAAIFTAATSGISVNGQHLRKNDDKGRPLYGHLHSGDVIQVYHAAKGSDCLRFTCEFYHSAAKTRRPAGQSFQILSGSKNVL